MTTGPTSAIVIDDDPVSRAVVRVMLERAGHEVVDAGDVASGLAAVIVTPALVMLYRLADTNRLSH